MNVDLEQMKEYETLYLDEIKQIRKICQEDMTKIVEKYLLLNFDIATKHSLNTFLMTYHISLLFQEKNNILTKSIIDSTMLQLQESILLIILDYIFDYFSIKMNELNLEMDCEEWKEVNFQLNYNKIVKFILKNKIKNLKGMKFCDIINKLGKYDVKTNDELNESAVTCNKEKYKIINSILFMIRFLLDTEKLILIFDKSLSEIISQKVR